MEIDKTKELLINMGWLNKNEHIFFDRLKFNENNIKSLSFLNNKNIITQRLILDEIIQGKVKPAKLNCCLSDINEDIVLGEIDRYGLPIRTVLNNRSGLIRTDPYYCTEWLNYFYRKHYRNLYTSNITISKSNFFANQIIAGDRIYKNTNAYIKEGSSICEIGSGMGGILIPFKMNGHKVIGVDYGAEYIELGKEFGVELIEGDIDTLINKEFRFDLIILSHIIEHLPEINKFLDKLKLILKKDGLLYISVPGINSISYSYNFDFLTYLQNAHCWHFSMTTLENLLKKNSFHVLKINDKIECIASISKVNYNPVNKAVSNTLSDLVLFEKQYNKKVSPSLKNRAVKKVISLLMKTISIINNI